MQKILLILFTILMINTSAYSGEVNRTINISDVEKYLKNVQNLKANFAQTSFDNNVMNGVFYLNRPGRLRFEYDNTKDFITADGTNIYFYDSEMEQQSHAPIDDTLASFILREDLSLSGDIEVISSGIKDDIYYIAITQKDNSEAGKMYLIFNIEPELSLKEWVVSDSQGLTTRVELSNIDTKVKLDKDFFYYRDPNKEKNRFN